MVNEAVSKYNLTEEEIVNNGYRIHTELDQNYQANMQVVYENTCAISEAEDGTFAQSGSVALEPKTGEFVELSVRLLTMIKTGFRNFNHATQSKRSPGSTVKPLVVYTPAVEAGWALNKLLITIPCSMTAIRLITMQESKRVEKFLWYQALAESLNLPAVATVNDLGVDKAFEAGENLTQHGKGRPCSGVAFGKWCRNQPLQMAQAYAAFC